MLVRIRAIFAIAILIVNAAIIAGAIRNRTRHVPGARTWLSGVGLGMVGAGLVIALVVPGRVAVVHPAVTPTALIILWLIGGTLTYFGLVFLLAAIRTREHERREQGMGQLQQRERERD
jgi:hypothetical protein